MIPVRCNVIAIDTCSNTSLGCHRLLQICCAVDNFLFACNWGRCRHQSAHHLWLFCMCDCMPLLMTMLTRCDATASELSVDDQVKWTITRVPSTPSVRMNQTCDTVTARILLLYPLFYWYVPQCDSFAKALRLRWIIPFRCETAVIIALKL